MKSLKIIIISLVLIFFISGINTSADIAEIKEEINYEAMYEAVSDETEDLLQLSEINEDTSLTPDYGKIIDTFRFIFEDSLPQIFESFIAMSVICILSSILFSFENNISDLSFTAIGAIIIYPSVISVSAAVKAACESLSVFIKAAIPVYAGIVTFSGKTATGAAYTTLTLFSAQTADFIVTSVALPLIPIMLILYLAASFTGRNFGQINENIQKALKWTLVLTVTVFSAVTSLQTVITSNTDALKLKGARLAVSTAVPIVGSALGDALSAVQGGLAVIRSGAGAFGILVAIFIFAPVVIKCTLNILSLFFLTVICDLFNMNKLNSLISGCISLYKLMIACCFTLAVAAIISAAILIIIIK